jgi:hypothetical protein
VDGEPIDHGDCVNVDEICSACAMVVGTTSWTKEAWEQKRA